MTCHNCGAENPPTVRYCQNCGTALEPDPTPADPAPPATDRQSSRIKSNSLLFALIGAVAILCVCVCGAILAITYVAPDAQNLTAQFSARPSPTPTRRTTSTPALDNAANQDTSSTSNLSSPTPASSSAESTPLAPAASFVKWNVAQVESAFRAARLEFANPRAMTSDDYGTVPQVAKEAARFFLPSLGGQKGGRIYSFSTAKDLQTVQQYYADQSGTPPHILIKDNILVQIHSDLSTSLANKYQNALNALR